MSREAQVFNTSKTKAKRIFISKINTRLHLLCLSRLLSRALAPPQFAASAGRELHAVGPRRLRLAQPAAPAPRPACGAPCRLACQRPLSAPLCAPARRCGHYHRDACDAAHSPALPRASPLPTLCPLSQQESEPVPRAFSPAATQSECRGSEGACQFFVVTQAHAAVCCP